VQGPTACPACLGAPVALVTRSQRAEADAALAAAARAAAAAQAAAMRATSLRESVVLGASPAAAAGEGGGGGGGGEEGGAAAASPGDGLVRGRRAARAAAAAAAATGSTAPPPPALALTPLERVASADGAPPLPLGGPRTRFLETPSRALRPSVRCAGADARAVRSALLGGGWTVFPSQIIEILDATGLLADVPEEALAELAMTAARARCAREACAVWRAARRLGHASATRDGAVLRALLSAFVAGGLQLPAWEAYLILFPRPTPGPLPSLALIGEMLRGAEAEAAGAAREEGAAEGEAFGVGGSAAGGEGAAPSPGAPHRGGGGGGGLESDLDLDAILRAAGDAVAAASAPPRGAGGFD
jgi:hypothetical protein